MRTYQPLCDRNHRARRALAAPTLAQADKLQDVLGAGKLRVAADRCRAVGLQGRQGRIDADLARLIAADMGVKLSSCR